MRNLLANRVQKSGAAVALLLAISIILLHYPFGLYDISRTEWSPGCPVRPSSASYFNGKLDSSVVLDESNRQFQCEQAKRIYLKPFQEWMSYHAVVPWLMPAKNALVAAMIVVLAGLTWVWIFRDAPTKRK